jgi:hypothetical protein
LASFSNEDFSEAMLEENYALEVLSAAMFWFAKEMLLAMLLILLESVSLIVIYFC